MSTEVTHKTIGGKLVQLVSADRLREILDQDGDTHERPDDFRPDDEWFVAERLAKRRNGK